MRECPACGSVPMATEGDPSPLTFSLDCEKCTPLTQYELSTSESADTDTQMLIARYISVKVTPCSVQYVDKIIPGRHLNTQD